MLICSTSFGWEAEACHLFVAAEAGFASNVVQVCDQPLENVF